MTNHGHMTVSGFSVLVGDGNCVADEETCAAFAVDGLVPRCVVFPRSEEEAARVLKRAAEDAAAVIVCGSGAQLGAGNAPRDYDVALSLRRMNRVVHFEPADLTATVEAGMALGDFQELLRPHGLWLPVDPPGGRASSLGGIVAANASGPLRLRYGAPRDFVLGMKIATAEGKVIKAGGRVVKNVAGYDLSRLLIGSYGTLGVIAEISLKLFPLPAGRASWRIPAADLDVARQFRRSILQSPLSPMRMVLLDAGAMGIARAETFDGLKSAFEIWVEAGGSERVIQRFAETLRDLAQAAPAPAEGVDAGVAGAAWDRIAGFESFLPGSDSVILKATLPVASNEGFVEWVAQEAGRLRARHACVCQNGVGIVRACLVGSEVPAGLAASIGRLRAEAASRGGALTVERCPRELKAHIDVWGHEGSDFGLMAKLKQLWDPKGNARVRQVLGRTIKAKV